MPAIVTHHIFGREVHEALADVIGANKFAQQAFLLGNMGPDPLLCLKPVSAAVPYGKLGTLMHTQHPTELLDSVHEQFLLDAKADTTRAYALGFLCHYLLDSTVHPLVYAQERAICKIGVKDMSATQLAGAAHALIETELDERVLAMKLGLKVDEFSPHRETLNCSYSALMTISRRLAKAATHTYKIKVPANTFEMSVQLYRRAQFVLDAQRFGVRSRFDYARILGDSYPHVLALSHKAKSSFDTMFANEDHVPWPDPFEEGRVIDASFDELYQQAYEAALEWIPRYVRADFHRNDCKTLTGGINFRGQRVE